MSGGPSLPTGSGAVSVAVLAAALLHALWNGLAHRTEDKLAGFTLISLTITGCAAVMVCFVPAPDPAAWPFIALSTALQAAYQGLLLRAYQLGDFGQMYPIARGSAPLLVAVASWALLGERSTGAALLGVAVISCGLIGLAFADGLPTRSRLPALAAALGTGVAIASYTIVDGSGVRHAGSVGGYIAWLFLCQGPVLPLLAWARYGRGLAGRLRPQWRSGLVGGVLSLTAYGLVVWAQAHGSLATVAALRETSIVIAALIATLVFRERLGRVRTAASAVVLAGIAVMELAHP
ncbi:EamA family transporter [Streptomyces sp. NPDC059355]|uniref:EamA family transporter n=1 Tax=Streptomyces sp. NPDC059355 TaxID=3346811 RepID=UPI0036C2081C